MRGLSPRERGRLERFARHADQIEPRALTGHVAPFDLLHGDAVTAEPVDVVSETTKMLTQCLIVPPEQRFSGVLQDASKLSELCECDRGAIVLSSSVVPALLAPRAARRMRHHRVGAVVLARVTRLVPAVDADPAHKRRDAPVLPRLGHSA